MPKRSFASPGSTTARKPLHPGAPTELIPVVRPAPAEEEPPAQAEDERPLEIMGTAPAEEPLPSPPPTPTPEPQDEVLSSVTRPTHRRPGQTPYPPSPPAVPQPPASPPHGQPPVPPPYGQFPGGPPPSPVPPPRQPQWQAPHPPAAPPVPRPPLAPPRPPIRPEPAPPISGLPPVNASQIDEYTIIKRRSDQPRTGWRRAVHRASGGLINPGASPVEQRRQELALRARTPLLGTRQIAVASMKGGVGKTTVTSVLGLTLAEHRGDRVVALDANPDAGTLGDRLTGSTDATVRDLLNGIDDIRALSDVARYTALAGRLQVVASEQDPAAGEAFDHEEYQRVCAVLANYFDIIVTDSGTGMVHSAMDGTLALADELVIVGSLTIDAASRAAKTLDWLYVHGYGELVRRSVAVLSHDRTSKEIDATLLREHFGARCRGVVEIPHDPHLATGGRIELDALQPATMDAFLELAALVAEDFGTPAARPTRGPRPGTAPPPPGYPNG